MDAARQVPNLPHDRPPVLFIHGIFSHPRLLAPWVERFEAAGYECHAPALPGREPTDEELLSQAGLADYFKAVLAAREALDRPPIVLGHSLGGLLGQKLAATTETAALVLLASVPPGVLWTQPRSLPHLIRLLPRILAGKPILPPERTFRAIPFSTLSHEEQDGLVGRMVADSGRAFRSLTFGSSPTRVKRGAVASPVLCVSGTADRNVSTRAASRIAKRYAAEHQVHSGKPHWIVAESLLGEVAPPVLEWLQRVVAPGASATATRRGALCRR